MVHERQVLLRKHEKYGIWLSVGGHVDPGEDPVQAAVREVVEEVGLAVRLIDVGYGVAAAPDSGYVDLPYPLAMNRHHVTETHDHVTFSYVGIADSAELTLPPGPEGQAEVRWFSVEDLSRTPEISETIRRYATRALELAAS